MGDGAIGDHLVRHPDVRLVSFTGSTATGKKIMASAVETLGLWNFLLVRDGTLRVERLALPAVGVANCTAFSPDGRRLYFTDSPTRCIWCVDYPAEGRPGTPEVFARLAPDDGFPDGACTDADGGLWVAVWDGAAVLRFDPDGRQTDRIALPACRPTCPAFGGTALDTLYVTSARVGLDAALLAAQPAQGALLAVTGTGRRGRPEALFHTPLQA